MSIELKPSRNYPGRTALAHKSYPESNSTTILDLTPEDIKALVEQLTEAGHIKPQVIEQEEMTVYGYAVLDRQNMFIRGYYAQQEAIDFAEASTKDCKEAGIDWDYRVAAIVDQGGL